jgi:hypothetical protein
MATSGLKNEGLINELLISGSSVLPPRNAFGVYSFDASNLTDGVVSGHLTKPKYNNTELIKSVDTVIVELLPIEPPPLDDNVPRPIYNEATQSVIDLTADVARLNTIVTDLQAKVNEVQIVSESLKVSLDLKDINLASAQNQTGQLTSKVSSTIVQLQNSIQKATAESIQRVSLYARNQSLQQELDALRIAASAKEQALAAGAVSTGQLASILFDKGDPTKGTQAVMISMDYGGGYGSTASAGKFAASNDPLTSTFRSYFDVIASAALTGNKQITVDIKFSNGGITSSPFDFGVTFPVTLKENETKRFDISKPSSYLNRLAGQHGGGLFSHSSPTVYNYTMSIIVSDGTKTETKDFTMRLYNHN